MTQLASGAAIGTVAKRPRRHRRLIPPAVYRAGLSFIVAVLAWEIVARFIVVNPLFFTPLSDVVLKAGELWGAGELQHDIAVSFSEFALGFLLAAVAGIAGGIVMAASRTLRGFLDPLMSMAYATPIIALGPLFILWLGIGIASKVAIIFLTAVFPILINTVTGLTTTEQNLVDVARSLGGSQAQIYGKVRLPAALPYIIAGLRLSVARALVGVVVAELFGARAGLGFLIVNSAQSFDTAAVFVGVLILAIAGALSVEALKFLETVCAPWRFGNTED